MDTIMKGAGLSSIPMIAIETVKRFHATTLSNFLLGFDKYSRRYDKSKVPNNRYPGNFYVLEEAGLQIGIDKTALLLRKLGIDGDKIVIMETMLDKSVLKDNIRNGIGQYIERNWISVEAINYVENDCLVPIRVEDAVAEAYSLLRLTAHDFQRLKPRSISILPVAKGCQAKCKFCFSESSISLEQEQLRLEESRIKGVLKAARERGAERAVITGGGEPGLLPKNRLHHLLTLCKKDFAKVVMISNGYSLLQSDDLTDELIALDRHGLSVLSISRHHHDRRVNTALMGLDIASERIAKAYQAIKPHLNNLSLRWVCVLQKQGIENEASLREYLAWVASSGVGEICFKELYVSSSAESLYFDSQANQWSFENQVGLDLVMNFVRRENWRLVAELPWGCPIFEGKVNGQLMRVAAYTEPSLSWELKTGICRSWNLMADGSCYASLETLKSSVMLEDIEGRVANGL